MNDEPTLIGSKTKKIQLTVNIGEASKYHVLHHCPLMATLPIMVLVVPLLVAMTSHPQTPNTKERPLQLP